MNMHTKRLIEKSNWLSSALQEFVDKPEMDRAVDAMTQAILSGHVITACGNGGNISNADHLLAEFIGRFRYERRPLAAISFTSLAGFTSLANDYGYDHVFSRQVQALLKGGDILVVFSTSGNSRNLIEAVRVAREIGVTTLGFSGPGGKLKDVVDIPFAVPSHDSETVEEAHFVLMHLLCELVEERVCAEDPEARLKHDLSFNIP